MAVAPQQDNVPWHTTNTAEEQFEGAAAMTYFCRLPQRLASRGSLDRKPVGENKLHAEHKFMIPTGFVKQDNLACSCNC